MRPILLLAAAVDPIELAGMTYRNGVAEAAVAMTVVAMHGVVGSKQRVP